jgi:hypothetical protein
MKVSVSMRLSSLLLCASAAVVSANAQNHPASPSGADLRTAKALCPSTSTFQPNHLENNADILKAANGLAIQMIGRYNADPSKRPDMSDQWGRLDLAIISAADPSCVAETVTSNKITKAATAQATTAQTNKQVGAPPSSAGSTSAVQKVGIPELLGIAVNNGAVTNNVTGTTMTLSSSPYGFITAFGRDDDTQFNYDKYWLAARIGVSATFNVASSTDALASATRKQVSQWQIKGTFRDTSVRSTDVNKIFRAILQEAADAIVKDASNEILDALYRPLAQPANTIYTQSWETSLQTLVSQAPAAADTDGTQKAAGIANQLLHLLDNDSPYQKVLTQTLAEQTSNLSELIQKYEADNAAYRSKETEFEKAVAAIAKGWNGDILFGQRFPTTATSTMSSSSSSAASHMPDYLLGEVDITCDPKTDTTVNAQRVHCFLGKHTSITGNFSTTFYTSPNATLNEKIFRGAQAALQAQWNLGPGFAKIKSANDKSQMTLSVSGSYQRLQEDKDQSGKRPDIVLGTIKLEIPISGGTSVPLSFAVANASEQVKGTYVKGNFGISFDLDKLASLLKASQ